jgi:hypothetical protein
VLSGSLQATIKGYINQCHDIRRASAARDTETGKKERPTIDRVESMLPANSLEVSLDRRNFLRSKDFIFNGGQKIRESYGRLGS